MRVVMVGGFLGAGKTTTMLAAARLLQGRGERVAVITNDQGTDLVDTRLAQLDAEHADVTAEVTGGCFCCRFDDLAESIARVQRDREPTVVLAEAVGSCTDLQSTVVRPLRQLHQLVVSPLTVVLDPMRYAALSRHWLPLADEPDLAYLYRHQLDEADVIAVNKTDRLPPGQIEQTRAELGERFPGARVHAMSAATGAGVAELAQLWTRPHPSGRRAFAVDYDRYGAAEAELAWTNQTFHLAADAGADAVALVPANWVDRMLGELARASADQSATIGHVKVLVETPGGVTKASLTATDAPTFDHRQIEPAQHGAVTINARVQVAPEALQALLDRSIAAADQTYAARSGPRTGQVFRPGFPVPVHRM